MVSSKIQMLVDLLWLDCFVSAFNFTTVFTATTTEIEILSASRLATSQPSLSKPVTIENHLQWLKERKCYSK